MPRVPPGSSVTTVDAPGCTVGICLVKKSAIAATIAMTNSAPRSAARRASAFTSNTAWMVASEAPYASSPIRAVVSETNGAPAPNVVCASALRLSGMLGLESTPWRNNVVRIVISTEPTRAVPSEAPRFKAVFCSPPTSELSLSGTADTVTAPSCDASAPMPRPMSKSGTVTTEAVASASRRAISRTVAARSRRRPIRTTLRGDAFGQSLGTPIADTSSASDSGMSRIPVSIADNSSTIERNNGMVKKMPAWIKYWKRNIVSPPTSCRFLNIDGRTSGSLPSRSRRPSQANNTHRMSRPARISHATSDRPKSVGASSFGVIHPQTLERNTPKTASPSPRTERMEPTKSRRCCSVDGASWMRRDRTRITKAITTSPTKTYRQDAYVVKAPPISGPRATAIAPAAAIVPYVLGRRWGAKLIATRATTAGIISAAPMPSRKRPSDYQDAEVRRQSGRERPGCVDHATDRESASTSDNGPNLASGEHQGRHHECVERDSSLDPCDRRADVFRDCRNRHVHHRTVQRHEELCRSKRQQYKSRAFSGNLLWLLLGYHGLLSFVWLWSIKDSEKAAHPEKCAALFFLSLRGYDHVTR